jgi:hypothetical protein
MENSIVVEDHQQIDRILREERKYILKLLKPIIKSGCNVLLIQKSILRDAVNDLALHYLAKKGIMVIKDIERTEVEFIATVRPPPPLPLQIPPHSHALPTSPLATNLSPLRFLCLWGADAGSDPDRRRQQFRAREIGRSRFGRGREHSFGQSD